MSTEITLPALGESVTEGTVSRWLKSVGDTVEVDEPILEVSTDKVDTEIPAPVAGVLLEIRVNEDDVAQIGQVLGVIGDPAGTGGQEAPVPAAPEALTPLPAPTTPSVEQPAPPQTDHAADESPAQVPAPGPAGGTEVTLPQLGESVTEGTVSRWLKTVGDSVEADEPLLEVSTDKVDTEVPSPVAGTLLAILVKEDEVAAVGQALAVVGDAAAQPAAPAPTQPEPAAAAAPLPAAAPAPTAPSPAAPAQTPSQAEETAAAARRASAEAVDAYVTPLVRKLARQNDVDLAGISGTGVGGRIRKQDVIDAAEARKAAEAAAAAAAAAPAAVVAARPATLDAKRGSVEKISRLRSVVAKRMTESLQTSAQLTATVEVDLTTISRLRDKVKDAFRAREGVGLTYLAFITKATTEALKQFAQVNASIDTEAGTITYHDSEDIGIAVDTERGLLVPVIRGAGDLNITGIAKKITDLGDRTKSNKVTPDELSGGTFTITNYGSTGTLFDTPIINQPQVAIMGTGALVRRPVVLTDAEGNDSIAVRHMMYLSLTYDHRLIDGADAARFLSAVKARLEAGDFGAEFGL